MSIFAIGLWGMVDGFITVGDFVAAATIARSLSASSFAFIGLGQSVTRALGTIRDAMPVMTEPTHGQRPAGRRRIGDPARVASGSIMWISPTTSTESPC